MNPKVKALLDQPDWHEERERLRSIALGCGLDETVKWAKLCYVFEGHNVVIIYGLKHYCALGFFKGVLLRDPDGILVAPGQHSQAMRQARFTSIQEIDDSQGGLTRYIQDAIELERAGRNVTFREKDELEYPRELARCLDASPSLQRAFDALTPGRKRGYVLHFSDAKTSSTRMARIERCIPKILEGRGRNER